MFVITVDYLFIFTMFNTAESASKNNKHIFTTKVIPDGICIKSSGNTNKQTCSIQAEAECFLIEGNSWFCGLTGNFNSLINLVMYVSLTNHDPIRSFIVFMDHCD